MRRAPRTDANQAAIVAELRRRGAFVASLAGAAGGIPDLLVAHRGRWLLIEVKDGAKKPSARRLTPAQVSWHAQAAAVGAAVHIVESPADVDSILHG